MSQTTLNLSETRFTTIDGTSVVVEVDSMDEAKHALKELRHLKRELRHYRKDLNAAFRAARARERRNKRRKPQPLFTSFGDYVGLSIASLATLLRPGAQLNAPRAAADLNRELARVDETIHNIDDCALDIEGKLISDS
ncbi:MAG: hypothetical protein AAFQ45_09750 [Pseudomonadota bacterium]